MAVVTLLTDFGTSDHFVAAVKGVLLARCPGLTVVDVSHQVPAQDLLAGAWTWNRAWPCFPPATVHLGVVDPGVGSTRRVVAAAVADQILLGPDNGLLPAAVAGHEPVAWWALDAPRLYRQPLSATFHGRDVFAPLAAALAGGTALAEIGTPIADPVVVPIPAWQVDADGCLHGRIVHLDHFGNALTNLPAEALPASCRVGVGEHTIPGLAACYAAVAPGAVLALVSSDGCLEIAIRDGSAARDLELVRGQAVVVTPT